ncbi:MAG TPA: response regulator transcription factor [Bacteroidales bacterium]|nr:response regulator transcription factor [Bacteroidales bacterium]
MIRVLVTDDHPVVRKGLIQLLLDDKDDRFGPMDEAGNGAELLDRLKNVEYDVLLLDISMPGRNGLDLITDVKKIRPGLAILILSIYPEEHYAVKALRLGASGYLTKDSAPSELLEAVFKVSGGGRYITTSLAEKIAYSAVVDEESHPADILSARELEVIRLFGSGKKISDIARELSLSPKTISTYRERILDKLSLRTTSEIIRYAITKGLV